MNVPAMSLFVAISELFVTAAIFYVILSNLRGRPLAWKLLSLTLAYELLVNMNYMIRKTASMRAMAAGEAPASEALSPAMTAFAAAHGIFSLLMFLALLGVSALAIGHMRRGKNYFQERPRLAIGFLVLWTISVLSGEVFFVLRHLA